MTNINNTTTYPNTTPALTDHVPGTDVSDTTNSADGETVTFTMQAMMDLHEANIVLDTSRIQSGTFADARIAESNVTQHQAALSITESQISDLQSYLLNITAEPLGDLSDVSITTLGDGEVLVSSSGTWINQTLAEAGIAAASHTHTLSDITDSGTIASQDANNVTITGGSIDGATIGGTTPAAISGTTGTFSGDLAVNTDDLFVDVSAGRVGIGTTSPAQALHVVGGFEVEGEIVEEVYTVTGTTPALDPANGTIQTWTLTANSTPTDSLAAGESITLMIDDGTAYTITWPTITWVNNGGSAPTLATTGYTVVALWKVSTTLYGALVGDGS